MADETDFPVWKKTEDDLDKFGIKWAREWVKWVLLDVEQSTTNQARLKALDDEVVDTYEREMLRGDEFPPVVLWHSGRKLLTADGIHRLKAMERIRTKYPDIELDVVPAYVIAKGTPLALIRRFTLTANTTHGLPASRKDKLAAAAYLLDQNFDLEQVASDLKLSDSDVRAVRKEQATRRRAVEAKVNEHVWGGLPETSRQRLVTIPSNTPLRAAVTLVGKANLKTEEVSRLVTEICTTNEVNKQLAIIKTAEAEYGDRMQAIESGSRIGVKGGTDGPRQRWGLALGSVIKAPDMGSAIETLSRPELVDLLDRVKLAEKALRAARSDIDAKLATLG